MEKEALDRIAADLRAGVRPELAVADFPCFSEEALTGKGHVDPSYLDVIAGSLTAEDAVVFERAARAVEEGDLAWIGFKIVYDADAAVANTDNEVTKKYGEVGSADGEPLVFFCNDAKEIVASREVSPRDMFQMKDVTRGPSMHNEQFEGLTGERRFVRPRARVAARRIGCCQRALGARRSCGVRGDGCRLRRRVRERGAFSPCASHFAPRR